MAALVSGVQTLPPIPSLLHQVLPRHRPERRGACIGAAREPWNCCCMLLVVLMAASRKWTSLMLAPALVLALVAGVSCAGSVSSSENLRRGTTRRRSLADVLPNGSSSMAKWNVQWEMVGAVDDPEVVVATVHSAIRNSTGARSPDGEPCGTGNPVDDCWRCDPEWQRHRKKLADCGMGFGKDAIGGRHGRFYRVTDPTDDDPLNPSPGTLRHAAIQDEPLWIVFVGDMVITLKQELVMNSYKTIDGRGANVHVAGGGCITLEYVTNIIIHGVHIHDCKSTGNAMVRSSPSHYMWRTHSDGDAVSIFASSHIWVDHCSLSNAADGLVDAIMGSTAITISNNYFTNHNEVMLLGHSDDHIPDKHMQVTIAFNHFGEGLIQRMPRCRLGYFHVVNNDYTHWEMYAIGGSAEPTINSQGNRYLAPSNPYAKEVTKRIDANSSEWKKWNWRSEGDLFLNGAYFTPSGAGASASYSGDSRHAAKSASMVGACTAGAGVLACRRGHPC